MFMLGLFQWWYGEGWKGVIASNRRRLLGMADMFSTKILLRTLFSPWRRIITVPGASLDAHARAFVDNLVSRFIGFTIRSFVLLSAGFVFTIVLLAAACELIFWPVVPLAGLFLIVWGLF